MGRIKTDNISISNDKQLFISWSGKVGKQVAELIYTWIDRIYEDAPANVFFSPQIEPGRQGYTEIMKALDTCAKGFFILTRERINSPWVHFEAGAISKANSTNWVIPIYVDVTRESLGDGPLSEFQSNITCTYDDLLQIILRTGNDLGWKQSDSYSGNMSGVQNEFKTKIEQLIRDILPDPVISKLHQNCQNYTNCYIDSSSGCLGHLDENTFFGIRKTVVENVKGELIICGPSLTEAIGRGGTNNRSLRSVLRDGIKSKRITSIKLMLTDLSMFESDYARAP